MGNSLLDTVNELNAALKIAMKMTFADLVTFEDCVSWPVGESRNIGGSVTKKVVQLSDQMEFDVVIPSGVIFPFHWHDCYETNKVLKGVYTDDYTHKVFQEGAVVEYEIGAPHSVANHHNEDLVLRVVFHMDKKTIKF